VAIVGTTPRAQKVRVNCPPDWTKKDIERLSPGPAISYDDVLNAHEFFSTLGSDWAKHLPKPKKAVRG
jgi:hypothetical protein